MLLLCGVPDLGLRTQQLRALVGGQPNKRLEHELDGHDDNERLLKFLQNISYQFSDTYEGGYQVVVFFESRSTPTLQVIKLTHSGCTKEKERMEKKEG
jgi:hypothetical protein